MKEKLIFRLVVIGVIILAWTFSMFPVQDRDILDEFKKLAGKQVAVYEEQVKEVEKAGGKEAVLDKLRALDDKTSTEYMTLLNQSKAADKVADYKELTKRLEALVKDLPADLSAQDRSKMSYRLLEKAAGTDGGKRARISLNDYVKFGKTGSSKLSNAAVLRGLRNRTAGKLHLGLDLQGGTEFIVGFDADAVKAKDPKANITWIRDQIRTILENRLNKLGVTEPEIRVEGDTSISVKMPAVSEGDKASIRKTIQDSAKLSFHLLQPGMGPDGKPYEMMTVSLVSKSSDGEEIENDITVRREPTDVLGSDIERAVPQQDQFGRWSVGLSFNKAGAEAFGRVTGANIGQQLAIVLDGKVYSAPVIQGAITGGSAQITGDFSYEEARQLATVISSGNLPADIAISSEFGTDPTLGADAVRSGFIAGIVGLALVVLFMVWYYKVAGCIAVLALVVNTLLTLGSMALLKATITMPGIAGMVLTIGMAVDANVLIFERIREELAKGKAIGGAIRSGYERAFSSIFDSNLTTLVTCFFLYEFGSGSVKGFAVTLACGIFASMFTAIYMTRAIFDLLIMGDVIHKLPMRSMSFLKAPHVDFLSYRKISWICSCTVIVISLLTMIFRGNSMLGIEFSGGTQISYTFGDAARKPAIEDLHKTISAIAGLEQARVGLKNGEGGMEVLEITTPPGKPSTTDEEIAAEKTALDAYNAANKAYANAEDAIKKAKDDAEAKKTALADAEKKLADAIAAQKTGDAAKKDELKKAVDDATKAKADAAAALTTAEADVKNAADALVTSNTVRKAADSELAKAQRRVDPNILLETLQEKFPEAKLEIGGTKIVGAHVGTQFKTDAFLAGFLALLGVIVYLAFRFEFKYGLAAVIAVIHDVICACGIFVLWGAIRGGCLITPSVIAALMTIIGYSLNDTIVIFDRIRETKELKGEMKYSDLVNLSINQTLSRTIMTTITTVLAVLPIMIFSGGDIQDFAWVMFMGLFIGTYSTIYIATSLIDFWQKNAAVAAKPAASSVKGLPTVK